MEGEFLAPSCVGFLKDSRPSVWRKSAAAVAGRHPSSPAGTAGLVGIIYPIQINISENVHSPNLYPKDTQKPSNLHSSSKFWHDISIINLYLQVTYVPQIVGIIYPIQIYISENVHSPNLYPKDTQKSCNLHSSSKCWHDISNINIYLQVTYTPQIVGIIYPIQIYISKYVHSPTLCQRADKNPLTYIHSPSVGTIYSIST